MRRVFSAVLAVFLRVLMLCKLNGFVLFLHFAAFCTVLLNYCSVAIL